MSVEQNSSRDNALIALTFGASAVAGLACIVLPAYILQKGDIPVPLWPIRQSIEQMQPIPSFIGLFITGMVCGYLQPRYWHLLGLATVVLLPVIAIIEMALNSQSHNLWPIEFIFYGVFGFPGYLGATLGRRCRNARTKESE